MRGPISGLLFITVQYCVHCTAFQDDVNLRPRVHCTHTLHTITISEKRLGWAEITSHQEQQGGAPFEIEQQRRGEGGGDISKVSKSHHRVKAHHSSDYPVLDAPLSPLLSSSLSPLTGFNP